MKTKSHNVEVSFSGACNFNEPETVANALSQIARNIADKNKDNEAAQSFALWLKNEAVGFVAALADAKRQDMNIGDQIAAALNTFAALLAMLVGASVRDADEARDVSKAVAMGFAETFLHMVAANMRNVKPCDEHGRATRVAERAADVDPNDLRGHFPRNKKTIH